MNVGRYKMATKLCELPLCIIYFLVLIHNVTSLSSVQLIGSIDCIRLVSFTPGSSWYAIWYTIDRSQYRGYRKNTHYARPGPSLSSPPSSSAAAAYSRVRTGSVIRPVDGDILVARPGPYIPTDGVRRGRSWDRSYYNKCTRPDRPDDAYRLGNPNRWADTPPTTLELIFPSRTPVGTYFPSLNNIYTPYTTFDNSVENYSVPTHPPYYYSPSCCCFCSCTDP